MPVDESACFELDCCPLSNSVLPIVVASPLLVEVLNVGPYPNLLDSLTVLQVEDFTTLLT